LLIIDVIHKSVQPEKLSPIHYVSTIAQRQVNYRYHSADQYSWDNGFLIAPGRVSLDIPRKRTIFEEAETLRFEYLFSQKQPKLSYAVGVYKWKWYVEAGVYIDEVIAEKRRFLEKQIRIKIFSIVGILVSCLIIIFFIIRFISNRILRNMQSLTDFFETSSTKFIPIDIKKLYFPEFSKLAESANRMVDEKNRASEALKESEDQLRGILDSVQIGIVIIDPEDYQIVSINPYAQKMVNLPEKEILGQRCNKFICPYPCGSMSY